MKKTKIVCSIGPSSYPYETFKKMAYAGMNAARVNFSHATPEEKLTVEENVKRVNAEENLNVALLFDTKGPEFRNGDVKEGGINLVAGNTLSLIHI